MTPFLLIEQREKKLQSTSCVAHEDDIIRWWESKLSHPYRTRPITKLTLAITERMAYKSARVILSTHAAISAARYGAQSDAR